jgi:polyisoprenoid-binding protein YceI
MKKTLRILQTVLFLLVHPAIQSGYSQAVLQSAASSVTIKGTSSLHDWEEKVGKFDVDLVFQYQENSITGIDKVLFKCQSKSITSESSLMNNKTYEALKTEKFSEISFKLISVERFTLQNGKLTGTLVGDLFLSGVTRRVSLDFSGSASGDKVIIRGFKNLKMSDFNITPPTALMGSLKTGDQVTIAFDLAFQVNNNIAINTNY